MSNVERHSSFGFAKRDQWAGSNIRHIEAGSDHGISTPPYLAGGSFFAVNHSKESLTSSPVEMRPSATFGAGGWMPKLVILIEVEPVNFSLSGPTRSMVTGMAT